ncbi:uncharacterized protein IUM83_10887 [Phytophthora cinnamomi]|uniref:uncharacterized protein n=1 Tax=Phytophthora cinnamomi TaxID=4785 RepID=UPI00355A6929|nr:hypothetical protein IUM83_10887 [Phytophthora cinnamomi]
MICHFASRKCCWIAAGSLLLATISPSSRQNPVNCSRLALKKRHQNTPAALMTILAAKRFATKTTTSTHHDATDSISFSAKHDTNAADGARNGAFPLNNWFTHTAAESSFKAS